MANENARIATLRTPLGRARGLGSAKSGVHHWWMQRVSSVALLPLTIWLIFALASMAGASHLEALLFIAHPVNAVLLLLFLAFGFQHTASGFQVIIEDYVKNDWWRVGLLLGVKGLCVLLWLAASLAVLRIAV